jgi:hypothetical protein
MKKLTSPAAHSILNSPTLIEEHIVFLLSSLLSLLPSVMSADTDTPLFDELFARMNDPSFCWGDEALLAAPTPAPLPTLSELGCLPLPDDDADWECPELVLRKDIWTHFPVTLIPLGKDAGGAERHSVQWHRVKLAQSRTSSDFDEDIMTIERRLLKALEASSKWDVLPAETRGYVTIVPETPLTGELTAAREICILRMNFAPEPPAAPATVAEGDGWVQVGDKPATAGPKPELKRLNDINRHFHVVWDNKTTGNPKLYGITIHNMKVKTAGLDVKQHGADLLEALKLSSKLPDAPWRVLPAVLKGELCRIELP